MRPRARDERSGRPGRGADLNAACIPPIPSSSSPAASGAGYGLMFLLGLAAAASAVPSGSDGPAFAVALVVALVLVSAGLVSSAFHLGRPERALRAFSQWRTSWLSREACLAAATYVPAVGLGAGWWMGEPDGGWRYLGLALAAGAAATVYSTAMIYRSLAAVSALVDGLGAGRLPRPRRRERRGVARLPRVAARFAGERARRRGRGAPRARRSGQGGVLAGDRQAPRGEHHRERDRARPARSRTQSRARIPGRGSTCSIPPHTEPNWLQREMGYRVARRHARRLRAVTWGLAFILPGGLCLAACGSSGVGASAALGLAAASTSAGGPGRTLALLRRGGAQGDPLLRQPPRLAGSSHRLSSRGVQEAPGFRGGGPQAAEGAASPGAFGRSKRLAGVRPAARCGLAFAASMRFPGRTP